jgi:hypothetical protein
MGGRVTGALLAAALLIGAGCGGDDGDDDATEQTSTTTEAAGGSDAETETTAAETTTTGPVATPWYNLQPGACIGTMPTGGGFSTVETSDCAEPHEGEVVFSGQPGNAGTEGRCTEQLDAYAGGAPAGFELTWFSAADEPPSGGGVPELPPAGAAGADLMIVCIAVSTDGTTSGSIAA